MKNNYLNKSTVEEIREKFDNYVDSFSDIDKAQVTVIDAPLMMELITKAAVNSTEKIQRVLDIGCGAGNNTVKLSQNVSPFDCDLVDLSRPMLERARERISNVNSGKVQIFQGDFREIELKGNYDVIIAAAVLHHLRDDNDWESAFKKIYDLTAPGGSVWITDLVFHHNEKIHSLMWKNYGEYLQSIGGEEFRDHIFNYIEKEDSPRSINYQLNLLSKAGYKEVEVLHKNSCFAAFDAYK